MRVTKNWLNEFVNLDDVSNERLYKTFNAIGLEVDSMESYAIPSGVVIGKILSCEKHPDADKLNVCQIDVGDGTRQIVCGAANVVYAKYVAVAMVGAVLGDLTIKDAKLRGVESAGMVCSSSELGLPDTGKGIMILDDSIGELEVGRELASYPLVTDTVIELELTANRGDCLSIHGVARDLSVALQRELKPFVYKSQHRDKLGIARVADIQARGETGADLRYVLAQTESLYAPFIVGLRLAMVEVELGDTLANLLNYATHATGVILRAYDGEKLRGDEERIHLQVSAQSEGIVTVVSHDTVISTVGINQAKEGRAKESDKLLLVEASYIHPELLVEAVANATEESKGTFEKDALYYKTSRGSEPELEFGIEYIATLLEENSPCRCYEGYLNITSAWEPTRLSVDSDEITSIIGQEISKSRIVGILSALGFEIQNNREGNFVATIPRFRHDIVHIQDITEEIVRIVGIDNIKAKALAFVESNRLTPTISRYQFKKSLRHRSTATGLHENVSFLFGDRVKQEKYGFPCVREKLDLTNPIAEDLNTLRSTIVLNLLEAVQRNVNYTEKSIGLFEIGAVFDAMRQQSERFSMVFSGQNQLESVVNSGKPKNVTFASFVERLSHIIGAFELVKSKEINGLIHPYQSADILYRGKRCGVVSKLHPTVQDEYGIPDTFFAEVDLDALMPLHINATAISKFQGVYKDLSLVIDKTKSYSEVHRVIESLKLPILKRWYPVDIYEDESLGEQKSLTVRLFIQSLGKTLSEEDIEGVTTQVIEQLGQDCGAKLR